MLILSRKKNEAIIVNHDVKIMVVEIHGDRVRLGIEAPKEVPVHREEVVEAINRGETTPRKKPISGEPLPERVRRIRNK